MSASAVMNHKSPALMGEVQPRILSRKEDLLALLDPALRQVSPRYVERNYVIPICVRDGVLLVATWDPLLDVPELADAVGAESIEYCLVTPTDFRRLLMSIRLGFGDEPHPEAEEPAPRNELLIPAEHEDARCVALLDSMLLEAVGNGASDLHLEHYGNHVRVRIRVDGDLMDLDQFRLTTEQLIGVINVVKIRARLDITERR
ncbi:MAG TPA: ATPase, T2SS/T4P/T4SS family, partial [Thermoanaerobaculia bacterium]